MFRTSLLLLGVSSLFACGGDDDTAETSDAPVAPGGQYEDVLSYLRDRYDTDGDGKISPEEHGRSAHSFAQLDKNKSGFIDADDFSNEKTGGRLRKPDRAKLVIARYLQADQDGTRLDETELAGSLSAADADKDQILSEEEFLCLVLDPAPGPKLVRAGDKRLLEGIDPWQALLAVLDEDGSGDIDHARLMAFHAQRGGARAWVWEEPEAPTEQGPGRPLTGLKAPEFALEPFTGGPPVALSSLRGRPVALIFGSYT